MALTPSATQVDDAEARTGVGLSRTIRNNIEMQT